MNNFIKKIHEMSKIEEIAKQKRDELLSSNIYPLGKDEYKVGHTRALSDEKTPIEGKGKEGEQGTIGSSEDIDSRNTSLGRNEYHQGNQYNSATNTDE